MSTETTEMTTEIFKDPMQGSVADQFAGYYNQAQEWLEKAKTIEVTDELDVDLMKTAREGRLFIKAVRVDVEKKRKELKDDSLQTGRAIDNVAKLLKELLEPIEQHLDSQEKYAEIQEHNRYIIRLNDRTALLKPFVSDTSFYDLGGMPDEAFNELFESSKLAHEKRKADQLAIEEKAKADELKAEAERQAQRLENERLKKERDTAQKVIDDQKQADEDVKRKELADIRSAALAPDKDKLNVLAGQLLDMPLPVVKEAEAKKVVDDVRVLLAKTAKHIKEKTELM